MGKIINDFLSKPIPPEVWHYTNLTGFEGIVSSARIWATEAHHTTDETEFVHARDVASRYLEQLHPVDESMARAKQSAQDIVARAFDHGALSPDQAEVFVASFCEKDDLESQWTGYADGGRGVSLSFDLRKVRQPDEIGCGVTFAPCLYETDEKEQMIEDALSSWVNTFCELHKKTGSQQWAAERLCEWLIDHGPRLDKAALFKSNQQEFQRQLHTSLTRTVFDLLRIASHCKNHAFYVEAEWRLALPHTRRKAMKYSEILYRGPNGAIPYVAHNLFFDRLPLVRVRIGPACENIDQIRDVLKRYGYDVPVERSTLPTRAASDALPASQSSQPTL